MSTNPSRVPEDLMLQGINVEIAFGEPRPSFGDLFLICGDQHPRFQPTGRFGFERLADLLFEQVDDYFGVRSLSDDGDDVPVWLYPLIDGDVVHHHTGPFDGILLGYSILRNPVHRFEHFAKCVMEFATLGMYGTYRNRGVQLGSPPDIEIIRNDFDAVVRYWATEGIVVGSAMALEIDC